MAIEIRGWRRCCKCLTWRHRSRFTGICWGFEGESTSKPRGEHFDRALFKLNDAEHGLPGRRAAASA